MATLAEVARTHARTRASLAERLRREALIAWSRVDPRHIRVTWRNQIPRLLITLTAAQHLAAREADAYLAASLAAQGLSAPTTRINPAMFAGIASDGRDLGTLLEMPSVIATTAYFSGTPLPRAMAAGGGLAQLIAHTQVTDAGRTADQAGLVADRQTTGYVRMVSGASCSRCLLLAGRRYRWNRGFQRHPHCDCVHVPAAEDSADDIRTDPKKAFEAMSAAEQDRVFTKAGAQAIRDGADMAKVVNARRGMQTASVFGRDAQITTEGTTARGTFRGQFRLMPETIYRDATSREDAIRLLKRFGYIL